MYQSGVSPDVNDIPVQAHHYHDFQRNHDEDKAAIKLHLMAVNFFEECAKRVDKRKKGPLYLYIRGGERKNNFLVEANDQVPTRRI